VLLAPVELLLAAALLFDTCRGGRSGPQTVIAAAILRLSHRVLET
jgi:hypothetical protein